MRSSRAGEWLLAIQADVTDLEATERAVATTVTKFGKLDILFANAGFPAHTHRPDIACLF